jgi:FkbM family methyltransferase
VFALSILHGEKAEMHRRPGFLWYYLRSIGQLLTGVQQPWRMVSLFLSRVSIPEGGPVLHLRTTPVVQMRVRSGMDVWSVKEALLDRFYELCGYAVQAGWTVVDVGAGIGEFTVFAAQQRAGRVLAFEPFPQSFALLEENVRLNHAAVVEMFPVAVGSKTGSLTLDLSGGEPLQFQSRTVDAVTGQQQLQVPCWSLGEVFERTGMQHCDLLKLDCEGAEYDILMKSDVECLQKIERIVMEYHDGVTEYQHDDLSRFLQEHGYRVEEFANPVYREIGYLRAIRIDGV